MQKIMEFRKRNFWTNRIDILELNEKIAQLNADGWRIVETHPIRNFGGLITAYILLLEHVG